MRTITERQLQVLEYVSDFYREHGVAPTMRNIADHFEWSSHNAAQDHLRALEKKGYLRHTNRGFLPA